MDILLTEKSPEEKSKPASTFLDVELVSKKLITPYLGIFTFKPEKRIYFTSGQYVTLAVSRYGLEKELSEHYKEKKVVKIKNGKGIISRPYSVASSPENENIELYIAWVQKDGKREDGYGILSHELFNLQQDTEFNFLKNIGKGNFKPTDDLRHVLMPVTSTGIAPCISWLRNDEIDHGDRRYSILWGVGNKSDLAYQKELEDLKKIRNLTYSYCVSKEKNSGEHDYVEEFFLNRDKDLLSLLESQGKSKRVSTDEVKEGIKNGRTNDTGIEKILGRELNPDNSIIMLCGNPGMIENIKLIAESKGYKPGIDLITESYWKLK